MVSRAILQLAIVVALIAITNPWVAMAQEFPPEGTDSPSPTETATETTSTSDWQQPPGTDTPTEEPTSSEPNDTTSTDTTSTYTLTETTTYPQPTETTTTNWWDTTTDAWDTTTDGSLTSVPEPTPTPSDPAIADDSEGGLSSRNKAIIGGVVGGVGGAILLGAIAFFFLRRQRLQRKQADMEVFNPHADDDDYRATWGSDGQSVPGMSQPFVDRPDSPAPPPPPHTTSRAVFQN